MIHALGCDNVCFIIRFVEAAEFANLHTPEAGLHRLCHQQLRNANKHERVQQQDSALHTSCAQALGSASNDRTKQATARDSQESTLCQCKGAIRETCT